MKNTTSPNTSTIVKSTIGALILVFAFSSPMFAQGLNPPSQTRPPAGNSVPDTGTTVPGTPGQAPSDNNATGEDFDSSSEPFGRGCPFREDDLQLIT